mgnify:CR=1 FL=1
MKFGGELSKPLTQSLMKSIERISKPADLVGFIARKARRQRPIKLPHPGLHVGKHY